MIKIILGERRTNPGPPADTEDTIYGQGWRATKTDGEGSRYVLEHISGEHGGGEISFEISEADFEFLKSNRIAAEQVINRYSNVHGDGWWAARSVRGCWARIHDRSRFQTTGDLDLSEAEFFALRHEPALFDTIYQQRRGCVVAMGNLRR